MGSLYVHFFKILNVVSQGGILSPRLFAVYVDHNATKCCNITLKLMLYNNIYQDALLSTNMLNMIAFVGHLSFSS